eukprot:UN06892
MKRVNVAVVESVEMNKMKAVDVQYSILNENEIKLQYDKPAKKEAVKLDTLGTLSKQIDFKPSAPAFVPQTQDIGIANNTVGQLPNYENIKPSAPKDNINKETNENIAIEKNACVICMDRMKSHAFNCGHVFCGECAQQFENKNCPICQTKVTTIIKLYYM